MTITELRFTDAEMELFAAGSGDRSPLHTDPEFARRTAFGEPIVYGGLLTLKMLGLLPAEAQAATRTIRSSYPGPVLVGATVGAQVTQLPRSGEWEVRLTARGKVVARVRASAQTQPPVAHTPTSGAEEAVARHGLPVASIESAYRPGPALDELVGACGLGRLDRRLMAGIAWASNVVGMTLPGFDGLCAAVTLVVDGAEPRGAGGQLHQRVTVRDYDERTDRVLIEGRLSPTDAGPGCRGLIECFPFGPTPLSETGELPASGEPEPERGTVLVVGGSRGLGAALVLALLARGYRVHAVYRDSVAEAEALRELAGIYASRLALERIDAADPAEVEALVARIGEVLDGLVLCAAPPALPMALTASSAGELARHVSDSLAVTAAPLGGLLPSLRRAGGWLVICSSSELVQAPRELPHVVAAKAALEGLGHWVSTVAPPVRVLVVRPPRMRTDAANTPSARAAAVPAEEVAAAVVHRLAGGGLDSGLTVVDPAADGVLAP